MINPTQSHPQQADRAKPAKALAHYFATSGLQYTPRKGWQAWQVQHPHLESVAEHTFSTMQLAKTLYLTYGNKYLEKNLRTAGITGTGHLDIEKAVLPMLLDHEDEEIFLGDQISISKTDRLSKLKAGAQAVDKLYAPFTAKRAQKIRNRIKEFDDQLTINAKFAYLCDKCDASLRAIHYKKQGFDADVQKADPNFRDHNPNVLALRKKGLTHMEEMWYAWWLPTYKNTIFADLVNQARQN